MAIFDSNNALDTNFGYANAATGIFTQYRQASIYGFPDWIYQNYEFYVQDNWKATPTRNRTPRWASEISPGLASRPPPIIAAIEAEWCGAR